MAHPYNESYLSDAMTGLAEAFDTAAFIYKFDLYFILLILSE